MVFEAALVHSPVSCGHNPNFKPFLKKLFEEFLKKKKVFYFLLNKVSFFDVCLANPSSQQTDVSNIKKTVTGVDDKSYHRSKVSFHFFQN